MSDQDEINAEDQLDASIRIQELEQKLAAENLLSAKALQWVGELRARVASLERVNHLAVRAVVYNNGSDWQALKDAVNKQLDDEQNKRQT